MQLAACRSRTHRKKSDFCMTGLFKAMICNSLLILTISRQNNSLKKINKGCAGNISIFLRFSLLFFLLVKFQTLIFKGFFSRKMNLIFTGFPGAQ